MSARLILTLLLVSSAGCNLFRANEPLASSDAGSTGDTGVQTPDLDEGGDEMGTDAQCGDGVVEGSEACERGDQRPCTGVGFDGGTSHCTLSCEWDESACYTCTVFVAPESGDDGNSGTSPQQPRQSRTAIDEHLNSASGLGAGDVLCFRRGESLMLPEPILITRSGSVDAPLIVGAYGNPSVAPPRFTAGVALPPANTWTDEGSGVYSIALDSADAPDGVSGVWVGDEELRDRATDATLADGVYFYDGSTLYISPTSLTSDIAASVTSAMMLFGDAPTQYVEVTSLSFDLGEHGVQITSGEPVSDIVIRDNVMSRLDDAIRISSSDVDVTGLTITDNHFRAVGNGVFWTVTSGRASRSSKIGRNTLVQPARSDTSMIYLRNAVDQHVFGNDARSEASDRGGAAIALDTLGMPGSTLEANTIERNFVVGFTQGIAFDSLGGEFRFGANDVSQNVLIEQAEDSIFLAGCDMSGASRLSHNTIVAPGTHSIRIPRDCGYAVVNNLSVIAPGTGHVDIEAPPAGFLIVPNSFDNNLYIPGDGTLWSVEAADVSFADWQALGFDQNGAVGTVSPFGVGVISDPVDAKPSADSQAIDAAVDGEAERDFGDRTRPSGDGADIGAWERQNTDE